MDTGRLLEIVDTLPNELRDVIATIMEYDNYEAMKLEEMVLCNIFPERDASSYLEMAPTLVQAMNWMLSQKRYQTQGIPGLIRNFYYSERKICSQDCQRFWCRHWKGECCCGSPVVLTEQNGTHESDGGVKIMATNFPLA